jgi:hypothetical protein
MHTVHINIELKAESISVLAQTQVYIWHQKHFEQELPTLPEHLSSPPVFNGVRVTCSLVL